MLHRTDMVKMGVRKNDSLDAPLPPPKRGKIWNDVIDAKHVFVGKLQPHIDDIEGSIHLHNEAVPPHLFKPPEGKYANPIPLPLP